MTRSEFAIKLGGPTSRAAADEVVVIAECDPAQFRTAFLRAAAGTGPVFVANPDWAEREWQEFSVQVALRAGAWDPERGWLMIPTGGTNGGIKLARHDQHTIMAAVAGYQAHFGADQVNAVGVLPLHHVGGLMGWLRCVLSGGTYRDGDWRALQAGRFELEPGDGGTISLVATQLHQLLQEDEGRAWLRGFSSVLLGGSALSASLRESARRAEIRGVPGYGMTETMAMVAAQRPDDFLAGNDEGMPIMPHAQIEIGEDGRIAITGSSLFRGYWPEQRTTDRWVPADVGVLTAEGALRVSGRSDDIVISGGEKVDLAEVERVLKELIPSRRWGVVGVSDPRWGQRVVACYAGGEGLIERDTMSTVLAGQLTKFKWPKAYVRVEPWPVNAMGKLNRRRLVECATAAR